MKYLVLGGYGEMGRIASRDLAETAGNAKIIIAGRDGERAGNYAGELGKRVTGVAADASKPKELADALEKNKVDVVVNCAIYYSNLDVMSACLQAKCHYIDLGGLFHMTKKQLGLDEKFKKAGLTAVLGCGSTPGITNVLAAHGAGIMDKIEAINVRFAGYSWTRAETHFVVPYSMYTVFDEFTMKPAVFRDGKMAFVKPISGKATEYFPDPIGEVKTFYTLHSELATFPASFKSKGLKNCDFKVSFDEDFVHDVQVLIEAGAASKKYVEVAGKKVRPVDVAVKELNRLIPDNKKIKDIEYIRVSMQGTKNKKPAGLTLDCLAHSNSRWRAAAGDVDTGTPPSIVAQMLAGGIIKKRGVLPPELCVPPPRFFQELARRGMEIFITEKRKVY
ncbi:MAG: saccharopine dehydrogenase NADP-binding domain-containing protein [Candidatus Aenigmarchaeota archaeon]|nr:saccharopine dehydrogenase NADP-binding domain-containing protein [Candidatus Aenigmarchaeota archaeon]